MTESTWKILKLDWKTPDFFIQVGSLYLRTCFVTSAVCDFVTLIPKVSNLKMIHMDLPVGNLAKNPALTRFSNSKSGTALISSDQLTCHYRNS